jgi:hypothetical protein
MKTIIYITIILFPYIGNCQNKFKYEYNQSGNRCTAVPNFEECKVAPNAVFEVIDEEYFFNLFYLTVKESVPEKVFRYLSVESKNRSRIRFIMDSKGSILGIRFSLSKDDHLLLTDDMLLRLYQKIKNRQLDMTKIEIIFDQDINSEKKAEQGEIYYCRMSIPFIPRGFEHKP